MFPFFDEPEAGIDLWSFTMLVDTFKTLKKNDQKSIIIISHQERIMQLADEIIVIADGQVKTQGTKDEVFPRLLTEFGSFSGECTLRGEAKQ